MSNKLEVTLSFYLKNGSTETQVFSGEQVVSRVHDTLSLKQGYEERYPILKITVVVEDGGRRTEETYDVFGEGPNFKAACEAIESVVNDKVTA